MKDTKELFDSALRCISSGNCNVGQAYATLIIACELQNIKEQLGVMIEQQNKPLDEVMRIIDKCVNPKLCDKCNEEVIEEENKNWEQLEFNFNKSKTK